MEINFDGDVEFLNDLLRGIESKVGAAVPICLLQPILTSCTNPAGGASTPIPEGTERASPSEGSPTSQGDDVDDIYLQDQASSPSHKNMSPIKEFSSKRQQMDRSCQRLRSDMNALREIDVSLMKQLLNVYDAIEEIRWMIESYDMSDSCESLSSSVHESIEQIHEKWVTSERRQWQSTSSKDLTSFWREDSRYNLHHVGRLNSTGSRGRIADLYGLSTRWRSPNKDLNRSFPQVTAAMSNFELHRRSSVDHLPIADPATEASRSGSPRETRKRRSSSGAVDVAVDGKPVEDDKTPKASPVIDGRCHVKKPKFLFHSQSSPSFDSQLQWVEVTDTANI